MSKHRGHGEGTICQRKDGRWCAALTLQNGRRKFFYGQTKKEVTDKLIVAQRDLQHGIAPANEKLTLKQYLNDWIEGSAKSSLRPRSYERYKEIVELHIIPGLGREVLAKLTPVKIERFLNDKIKAGLMPRTVQNIHGVLRRALKQAERWGTIPRNPASLVSAPRAERADAKPFTVEEAKTFLQGIQGDRLEVLYSVALALGLRQGEALGLSWEDVDLDTGTLCVNRNLQRIGGKLVLTEPKTRKSRRTLPLPPSLKKSLLQHKEQQHQDRLLSGEQWEECGLIFTSRTGKPLQSNNVLKAFKRALSRAGLQDRRFHDMRHSCASLLLAQNVPMRVVMDLLGHTKIQTTADLYSHVTPTLLKESLSEMDRLLNMEGDD
jgi:integrase